MNPTTSKGDGDFENSSASSISISVVLSRQKKNSPRIGMAACIPKKRNGLEDSIRFTIIHFSFFDDSRNFSNLNSLLNRLGNVGAAYVASTDNVKVRRIMKLLHSCSISPFCH